NAFRPLSVGQAEPFPVAAIVPANYAENSYAPVARFNKTLAAKSKSRHSRPATPAPTCRSAHSWEQKHDPFGIRRRPSRREALPAMRDSDVSRPDKGQVWAPSGNAPVQVRGLPLRGRRRDRSRWI